MSNSKIIKRYGGIENEKLVVINDSPRKDIISNTYKALMHEVEFFKQDNPDLEVAYYKLPQNLTGCINDPNYETIDGIYKFEHEQDQFIVIPISIIIALIFIIYGLILMYTEPTTLNIFKLIITSISIITICKHVKKGVIKMSIFDGQPRYCPECEEELEMDMTPTTKGKTKGYNIEIYCPKCDFAKKLGFQKEVKDPNVQEVRK